MATYLFHSSLSPITASRGIQYDEALRLRQKGHEVHFLYCNGLMTQCFSNITGDKAKCLRCKLNFKEEKRKFGKKINFVPLTNLLAGNDVQTIRKYKFEYNSIEDIQNLKYENIDIGIGALSGYITISRNLTPLIDDDFKFFFDQNLYNSLITIEAVKKAIEIYSPHHVVLYNGRFSDSRPVWQLAEKYNIPYTTLEAVYGLNRNYKSKFYNSTPHSIEKNNELINYYWNNSYLDVEARVRIGSSFFEKRKNAEYTGDKIYTKNQTTNQLPEHWDFTKKNIVIFNSSEDEYASVGDEYDKYKLFNSQLEGLRYIKEKLFENTRINITLRVHPNLSDIKYSYATDLVKLKSGNFDVIEADSIVSSYALLDNADTVVVFGSTMGIESVYWNKPTILLAGASYYKLDCCYVPNTKDELTELLLSDLIPKERNEAIKYGYYLVNEEWDGPSVLDFNWSTIELKLFNTKKGFRVYNWKQILNSKKLFSIISFIKDRLVKMYYRISKEKGVRFNIPLQEDYNQKI